MDFITEQISRLRLLYDAFIERAGIDPDLVTAMLGYDSHQPLLFNTGLFLVLFAIFMVIYRILRPWRPVRMIFTILFSVYFYYKTSGLCCLLLLGVALSDYLLGLSLMWARGLSEYKSLVMKRLIVTVNVLVNVGLLCYFKYFGLLLDTLSKILTEPLDPIALLLPAGISFFTFRSISYIVDIYRGQLDATRSLLDYLFYLTFFPPLLAGPVVRAKDMLPQIKSNPVATRDMTSEGTWLIIVGIIKKMVIADFISGNFVDRVFDNPALYSGFENLMATLGFTVQLYCDFSGYSDMAIGIALLMGYRFRENFNAPFKASNPTEFWHRWHISLSTWLRDYVYIPLGGNRCSKPRAYFNQAATMVIGGFWHGASWMYVIWGAAHGALLVVHKMYRSATAALMTPAEVVVTEGGELSMQAPAPRSSRVIPATMRCVNMVTTFLIVAFIFMLFRAHTLEDVATMWHQIIHDFHLSVAPEFVASYSGIVIAITAAYLLHILPSAVGQGVKRFFCNRTIVFQALLLALTLYAAIQVRSSDIVPFIYLQY
ncbi:MAG: MBOAT family protein [Bacteroides sp.]|nr:MBOAT family protein [Bacteroides sp.]